jgi:hypothetical protein
LCELPELGRLFVFDVFGEYVYNLLAAEAVEAHEQAPE